MNRATITIEDFRKTTFSFDESTLESLDSYSAAHFLPRAYAFHLLLMEGMEREDLNMDLNSDRTKDLLERGVKDLVQLSINVPKVVLENFEEFVIAKGFNRRQKFVVMDAMLFALLTEKGYWKGV